MKNIELSKKSIAIIALVLGLVALGFFSCSRDSKEEEKATTFSQTLTPSTTKPLKELKRSTTTRPQTVPTYVKAPFSEAARRALYALSKTGEPVTSNPGNYVSPRYEAILGGDTSSGIPISELDNPDHSDLDPAVFSVVRTAAIDVTKAQITGEGANRFPSYFNEDNIPGTCKSFEVKQAGATSLPIPNDSRWIVATVFWRATCGEQGASSYKVDQQTNVYFTLAGGVLSPRQYSEVPGA